MVPLFAFLRVTLQVSGSHAVVPDKLRSDQADSLLLIRARVTYLLVNDGAVAHMIAAIDQELVSCLVSLHGYGHVVLFQIPCCSLGKQLNGYITQFFRFWLDALRAFIQWREWRGCVGQRTARLVDVKRGVLS